MTASWRAKNTAAVDGLVIQSYNNGEHLLVGKGLWLFDFWPSTGVWRQRGGIYKGRGAPAMLALIRGKKADGLGGEKARSGRWDGVGR